jgi:hypothetical protein
MKNKILGLVLGALFAETAIAGPADYVYTPAVEYGEKEIDFKFGTARPPEGSRAQVASLGMGFGVTEYWFTEIYWKREQDGSKGISIAEWENKFQLTETGKYPVDIGLITEIEAPLSRHQPWEFKFGPLLQSDFGLLQLNANLLFERKFGSKDKGDVYVTEIGYQWQAKYRWQPTFEFGLQGLGEMGKWDDWTPAREQQHRIGPAVFGKIATSNHQALKYNAAWLIGIGGAAADNTFRMQLEYEL